MARTERDIRRELDLWDKDYDEHVDGCDMCDPEEEVFCPIGEHMRHIIEALVMELMAVEIPRMVEEAEYERGNVPRMSL